MIILKDSNNISVGLYQLKISLKHVTPPIWRRFVVKGSIKFYDLHAVIQEIMGWMNSHLHQFIINDEYYAPTFEDIEQIGINYKRIKLNDFIFKEGQKFIYEYDFGDGWEHILVLEKITDDNAYPNTPVCLSGKRNCPPEDCGGVGGYENLLKTIKNPKDPEYANMIEWLGGKFDSEFINIERINDFLKHM